MLKQTLAALALAVAVSGCATQPAARLTHWQTQYQNHSWQHPDRVCYREVINNRGFVIVREMNCQGKILKETRRYNRF